MKRDCLVILQPEFKRIQFQIIGDEAAPNYFQIDPDGGLITVQNDFNNIIAYLFTVGQLLVRSLAIHHIKTGNT